jgi:hypothetical protein
MLNRLSVKGLAILIAAIAIVLFGSAYLWIAGSAVVVDETGDVESASVVTSDGREQPLRRLWSGYFYTIPEMEGTIQVRCRDGSTKEAGYVTGYFHTKIRVVGDKPCAQLVEEF